MSNWLRGWEIFGRGVISSALQGSRGISSIVDISSDLTTIGWDTINFPISNPTLVGLGNTFRMTSGPDVVNLFTTFVGNPSTWPTLWVRTDGSNSNTGASEAQAFFTIEKAIQVANAANVPHKIKVKAGYYSSRTTTYI